MSDEMKLSFSRVTDIIETSKSNALKKVNEEMIKMYWAVGELLSNESKAASLEIPI